MDTYMMSETAAVGLVTLIPAIRCRDNKKYTSDNGKTVYDNEKNRYGRNLPLQKNALLLLLYLHFRFPDENGLVRMDIEDTAAYLKVNEKTICNNLDILARRGYISCSVGIYPYQRCVFIQRYTEYHKKASAGGRGYLTLGKNLMDRLRDISSIMELRVTIRSIIRCMDNTAGQNSVSETSYHELKSDLPAYCTRKKIRAIISGNGYLSLFKGRIKKYTILFGLKEEFDPVFVREKKRKDCSDRISSLISSINEDAAKSNGKIRHLYIKKQDLDDICGISLKYPVELVVKAVKQVYNQYIANNLNIRSLGGLVRTITENLAELYAFA